MKLRFACSLLAMFTWTVIAWVYLSAGSIAYGQAKKVSAIKVPDGFLVTQVATDEVATNIYSLAVRRHGRTFVSGPGYIKTLHDINGDGVYDYSKIFAELPKSGAQGICLDGDDLLCTGDGAVLKFTDGDQDAISDGPPERIFSIKTGGEHDAHSIRKGPDGWWYLLAGNGVPISKEFYANSDSPVKDPRAGFLMRISPDWSEKQIYCHGFRNAYDFDFNSIGEIFVFDSDGERDVSLPWYRPTRVYRMRPGDDAGFVAPSWKRPSSFFDMPPEVGALGRGSPTGVVVGQSAIFPVEFQDAIFVADWTFGRIVVFKRNGNGEYDRGSDFAVADGQFGFAVTDLDFDFDGSLLVSVGGRGTQGGVYRISFDGQYDPQRSVKKLAGESKSWSATKQFIQKSKAQETSAAELVEALKSSQERQRECGLEALLVDWSRWKDNESELVPAIAAAAAKLSARESILLARLLPKLTSDSQKTIYAGLSKPQAAILYGVVGSVTRSLKTGDDQVDYQTLDWVLNSLGDGAPDSGTVARLGQLAVGDCVAKGHPAMFVGYSSGIEVELKEADQQRYSGLLVDALKNASDQKTREEIGRLTAMIGVGSGKLVSEMARQLSADSSAPSDIHWLNCISQVLQQSDPNGWQELEDVETQLASALASIGGKIEKDDLNIDRNFYPRLKTLATSLFKSSGPSLADAVATRMTGAESDVFLLESLPRSATAARATALQKFAGAIGESPASATSAQVNVLASDSSGKHIPLIRSLANRPEFRGLVIKAILVSPVAQDRELLRAGLKSAELTTIKNAAIGLRRIFDKPRPDELAAAIAAAQRLGWDKPSVSVRDQLMMLAAKHETVVAEEIGYQLKNQKLNQSELLGRWEEWISANHPVQYKKAFANAGPVDWKKTKERIDSIAWDGGDAKRGGELYKSLQCAACHDGGSRLGPKLEGLSKRFSRHDIFKAIILPDQQVPQRYRALVIETVDGKLFRGSQVYDSADGITLQQIDGTTVRINKRDIEDRVLSAKSLMPAGLLKDSSDQDWADLYRYLIAD